MSDKNPGGCYIIRPSRDLFVKFINNPDDNSLRSAYGRAVREENQAWSHKSKSPGSGFTMGTSSSNQRPFELK